MKDFWVMWTYVGNYGGPYHRPAKDAASAGQSVIDGFSPDFSARGVVYVFDTKPIVMGGGAKKG